MLERERVQKIIAKNNCEYISVMNLSQSCTHIHREYRAVRFAQSMGEREKETERKKTHWPWFHSISNYNLDVVIWILYKEQQEYKIDANKIVKISKLKKKWEIEWVGEKKTVKEKQARTHTTTTITLIEFDQHLFWVFDTKHIELYDRPFECAFRLPRFFYKHSSYNRVQSVQLLIVTFLIRIVWIMFVWMVHPFLIFSISPTLVLLIYFRLIDRGYTAISLYETFFLLDLHLICIYVFTFKFNWLFFCNFYFFATFCFNRGVYFNFS